MLPNVEKSPQNQKLPQKLPLHIQIVERMTRSIAAGQWLAGDKLPTEAVLAAHLSVAVGTLRKALAVLTQRGVIVRKQGSGNYIAAQDAASSNTNAAPHTAIYGFFRLEKLAGGGLPTAQILSLDKVFETAGTAGEKLQQYRVRRIRFLDETPVALEEIYFTAASSLQITDLHESLYVFYETKLKFWISRVDDHISVAAVPDWGGKDILPFGLNGLNGLKTGEMAGFVHRLGYNQHGDVAEESYTWFDPSVARYSARWK